MLKSLAPLGKRDASKLIIAVSIPLAAGAVGSFFTSQGVFDWFPTLVKPSFTPPSWAFGPIWTTLYILMGIALFVVWRNRESPGSSIKGLAMSVFAAQLFLNILWSALFFGLRSPSLAFVDIVIMWVAIAATIVLFTKISRWAGVLLVPYIVWTTIALILNLQIWILNP